jgi:hypothetical protein
MVKKYGGKKVKASEVQYKTDKNRCRTNDFERKGVRNENQCT